MALRSYSITATGNLPVQPAGSGELWSVNVNTGAASAVLKIYNNTSAVAADIIATIDASATGSFWYGVLCPKGIFAVLSGGNADITIGAR